MFSIVRFFRPAGADMVSARFVSCVGVEMDLIHVYVDRTRLTSM
jgi:hypothetical protein